MKIGIVGYGSIGARHAANFRDLGHDICVYDPLGPSDVKFEREVYDTCDAVVIATPSIHHDAGLRACVERGKHVLIEKPISVAHGHLQKLLDIADEKKLVVMMGNNLRFHPCVYLAKSMIELGLIGHAKWAHFTCASESIKYSDGVILNTGSHEVDMAMYLLGPGHVISASAEDDLIADFVVKHDNGVRSSFHLDFITPNEIREFWIAGSKHNIGVDLPGRRISRGEHVTTCQGSYDDDYIAEAKAFIDRIEGKTVLGATGMNGLEALDVLLAVRKKAGLK